MCQENALPLSYNNFIFPFKRQKDFQPNRSRVTYGLCITKAVAVDDMQIKEFKTLQTAVTNASNHHWLINYKLSKM